MLQRWHLYQSRWSRQLQIGEQQDDPLFAVALHSGLFGRARLTLHAGPKKKSPVVATVRRPPGKGHDFEVLFPAHRPSDRLAQHADDNITEDVVLVKAQAPSTSQRSRRCYQFTIKVGRGWERWTQTFEWRAVSRRTGSSLAKNSTGTAGHLPPEETWELVCLDSDLRSPFLPESRDEGDREGRVALWRGTSKSKARRVSFAFVNAGATGELGQRFAELAMITGLALWDEEHRRRQPS
ncbi:hypothetical protein VTK73DRAFT_6234 [Phialemonium thermophilum]|uniref:Uncharacterized protein n=1 Tax=Phialemonium thermophilum TaxID=223376 RepID=A0ABR3WKP3_9PEZI